MEPVLYNIIEYGANPCILKLVCYSWMEVINRIDSLIIESVQWRIPDRSITYITMMLLDALDNGMIRKMLQYMSTPIVDWNLVSYLNESTDVARMIASRIHNRHTKEMCRRLGIDIPIPEKEIFKISSIIGSQNSTGGLMSMSSILSCGYIDALKILLVKASTENSSICEDQLYTLINTSLAMIVQNEVPVNTAVIQWLYEQEDSYDYIPAEIYGMLCALHTSHHPHVQDVFQREHLMMRISLDVPHVSLKLIPLAVMHQLGKRILSISTSSSTVCKSYILSCIKKREVLGANIRVIDAIIRNCPNKDTRSLAMDIADNNGWNDYISINS